MSDGRTELERLEAEYERVREKADAAKAKAKARLDRVKARHAEQARKRDAKRKIIAGGLLFRMAESGDPNAIAVLRELYRSLMRENARKADKTAFEAFEWPGRKSAEADSATERNDRNDDRGNA